MKIEACIIFFLNVACGLRRGPHHPHGHKPVGRNHHHYRPAAGDESIIADSQILHDAKHIEEDTKILTPEALAGMSPEELEFHYFSAHDFDRNNKLDGLELLKAIYHTAEHHHHDDDDGDEDPDRDRSIEPESSNNNNLDQYVALVDRTLVMDDTDNDGFISYLEYRKARMKNPSERTPRVVAAD